MKPLDSDNCKSSTNLEMLNSISNKGHGVQVDHVEQYDPGNISKPGETPVAMEWSNGDEEMPDMDMGMGMEDMGGGAGGMGGTGTTEKRIRRESLCKYQQ